jgi:predicted ATP-dependent serine protease
MSLKENLEYIKSMGIGKFIEEQYKKYRCSKCGGLISIHNRKCFNCDMITKLVDISGRRSSNKRKTGKEAARLTRA